MGTQDWGDDSWRRDRTGRSRRPPEYGQDDRPYGRSSRDDARGAGPSSRYGRRPDGDWEDARVGGGGRPRAGGPGGPGGSSRGARPPRDDYDDYPRQRSNRGAPPRSPRGDDYTGRRAVPQGQGALWDDERPRRPRQGQGQGQGGPRMGPNGQRYDPRDPRARRMGAGAAALETKKSGGISFGKAFGIIVLMFVLGGAAAFGVYAFTKPVIKADTLPAATPTSPAASPSASPSATPKATATKTSLRSGASPYVLVQA